MTASKYIKSRGLPSLAYVAKRVNKSSNTLNAWYRDNPELFRAVVAGVRWVDVCGDEITSTVR